MPYDIPAVDTPPPQSPSTILIPGTDPAPVALRFETGDTTQVKTKQNSNALMIDLLARHGGGAYAVTQGLTLVASGLVCTVAAGQAVLDGVVTLAADTDVDLADNAYNWIYLLQDGTPTKVSQAAATPVPACPGGACAFLGLIEVDSGTPDPPDYSGRLELRGGTLHRYTGDYGTPGDTPPADMILVSETAEGVYFWTGTQWVTLGAAYERLVTGVVNTTDATPTDLVAAGLAADGIYLLRVQVVGKKDDNTDSAAYDLEAAFMRDGATLTQIGSTATLFSAKSDASWGTPTLATDGATAATVRVVGKAGTNITWRGRMLIVSVN